MTTAAAELKVGALVLIALVVLGAVTYYVLGRAETGSYYPIYAVFDEAEIESGDRVRMAGVDVGYVDGVDLWHNMRARVRLMVRRGVEVYPTSEVTISSGAVFGERFVDIRPVRRARLAGRGASRPLRPNDKRELKGTVKPGLDDLMTAADALIARLQGTANSLDRLLGNEALLGSLQSALLKANQVIARANVAMGALADMTTTSAPRVKEILGNLAQASDQLSNFAEEMIPQIRKAALPEQVGEAARSLRNTAAAIEDTAQQVRSLLGDPALRKSLDETVASLRATAARMDAAGGHVERAADNIEQATVGATTAAANIDAASMDVKTMTSSALTAVQKVTGGARKPALPTVKGAVDLQYLPRPERWWTEANVEVVVGRQSLRLGATDIGENTGLNLQLGRPLGAGTLRVGLVQSKPGVGYDQAFDGLGHSLDLYDPNHLKGNLLLERPIGNNYSLVGGLRSAFDSDEETAAVGIRVRR